jgi:VCBS repeat-containing protein
MNVDLGGDDELAALQLLADGRIQLSGSAWTGSGGNAAVARLNADGTVDHSFGQVAQAVVSVSGHLFGSDPDRGDSLAWSGGAADAYGSLQVTPAGDWTFVLDTSSAATRALASGVTATEHFTATLTDGAGAVATHDITITIVGTNDTPAG